MDRLNRIGGDTIRAMGLSRWLARLLDRFQSSRLNPSLFSIPTRRNMVSRYQLRAALEIDLDRGKL